MLLTVVKSPQMINTHQKGFSQKTRIPAIVKHTNESMKIILSPFLELINQMFDAIDHEFQTVIFPGFRK
jgi:hypothetical protein